jgi:hypothetical protein
MPEVLGLRRRVLRLAARLLLFALSVTTFGPVVHGAHDDQCDPVVVLHDASQHHVQAPLQDDAIPGGDHCVACHFARASRGPAAWEPSGLTALTAGVLLYHHDGQLIAAPSAAPLPARAPPLV